MTCLFHRLYRVLALTLALACSLAVVAAEPDQPATAAAIDAPVNKDAQLLFAEYQDRIFQIQLWEMAASSKAAIGSGFQVAEGLVITNYHVVAEALYHPERYQVQLLNNLGVTEPLTLIDVDVVNDLALLQRVSQGEGVIPIAEREPAQGRVIYSIGNPHDLGMTVVEGTYNGQLPHSFYRRILFSGSINPGMSGGPALNSRGELVGVNVATSGNQLSFLVPAAHVRALLQQPHDLTGSLVDRVGRQLAENQQQLMNSLLLRAWPKMAVGKAEVVGEISDFIRCWGGLEDDDKARYHMTYSRCSGEDSIYISSEFQTGMINYEFYWLSAKDLNPWQFYNRYQNSFVGASSVNPASEKDVGRFVCQERFVRTLDERDWKTVLCVRPYKLFSELHDVMLMAATVDDDQRGLIAHFSLAGVHREQALAFTRKFMEHLTWK